MKPAQNRLENQRRSSPEFWSPRVEIFAAAAKLKTLRTVSDGLSLVAVKAYYDSNTQFA